jgi:putative transposase
MPHDTRAKVDPRYPLQVTIRAVPGLPSLKSPRLCGALRRVIARVSVEQFRVIHCSIQQDHVHVIVEVDEARRARGGMHGLAIRLALAVNRALGRSKGKVVGDRYDIRSLTTPRQMRASMSTCCSMMSAARYATDGCAPRSSAANARIEG